eukprot:GHVN01022705.1.p1 GENE.GHVN01022705.1~~GHVN01022705.1.p1  ORF type:complete len:264 (+),score=25.00 GHVN01022705.1:63-854(+)
MARGPRKHLKRVAAPQHWMLAKMGGIYAPRPSCGPHPLRECIPLAVLLRNRLKYALSYKEVKLIAKQRSICIDGKVRTDVKFPVGIMDVISIEKSKEHFRLLLDTKGRFKAHKIKPEEAAFKLCRVKRIQVGQRGVPYAVTNDGRTLRYLHPEIKGNDTVRIDTATGKVLDWVKMEEGNMVMITGGNNIGRVGVITQRVKSANASFEIVHVQDSRKETFATRLTNCFVIGQGNKSFITLLKEGGVKLKHVEDRTRRLHLQAKH